VGTHGLFTTEKIYKTSIKSDHFRCHDLLDSKLIQSKRKTARLFIIDKNQPASSWMFDFVTKRSWFKNKTEKSELFYVPYIDELGHFNHTPLCVWKTCPSIYMHSVVSTIYKRLMKRIKRKRKIKKNVHTNILYRMAVIHSFERNNYLLERLVNCYLASEKSVKRMIYSISSRLIETKRFYFDQVTSDVVASWLKFRRKRSRTSITNSMYLMQSKRWSSTNQSNRLYKECISNYHSLSHTWIVDNDQIWNCASLTRGIPEGIMQLCRIPIL